MLFDVINVYPNQSRYVAPRYFTTINRLPIVSATTVKPKMASRIKTKSPRIIPAVTAMPLATPNVAERVITKATLALGKTASATIIPNSVIVSMMLMILLAPGRSGSYDPFPPKNCT